MTTRRKLLFSVLVLAALLAVAEGLARLLGPGLMPPDRSRDVAAGQPLPGEPELVGDAIAGWRIVPGPNRLFGVPEATWVNSRGLRSPEIPLAEPAGHRRVIVLGDSSVYGVMVADDQTFASLTQRRLRRIDPGIEVLNGGCPGYSSWQAMQALRFRLLDYHPDLVVVATIWSDTQGADLPDSARLGHSLRPWLSRSHAYVLLRDLLLQARWGSRVPPAQPGQPRRVASGLGMPHAATWRVPLGEYAGNLREIARIARDHGAGVAFLVLPCVRDPELGRVGDPRDAWREAMRKAAAELGAPLADAPPAFAGSSPGEMFLDEVHPSARGHELIARVLARALDQWARGP